MTDKSFLFVDAWMTPLKAGLREKRHESAKFLWKKGIEATSKTKETASSEANNANDANACKAEQGDAPYYILSESKSESKSESEKKTSSTSHARVRGDAGVKFDLERRSIPAARNFDLGMWRIFCIFAD